MTQCNYTTLQDAIADAGLGVPHIIHDGQIHRFTSPEDKPRSDNCWYVSHRTAGAFGSWKLGFTQTWSDGKASNNAELLEEIKEYQRHRDADMALFRHETARQARSLWESASSKIIHPYPARKKIVPYAARQLNNALLVPMFYQNALWNLQRIYPDGGKFFLKGGRVKGCYFLIGNIETRILITEGYATACSIHERTSLPVAVAFNAGNLAPVAKTIRKYFPSVKVTIAGDNDQHTKGNPGMKKAREAAELIWADYTWPSFDEDQGDLSDFNDYINAGGVMNLPEGM